MNKLLPVCARTDGICRYGSPAIVAVGYECVTRGTSCSKCLSGTFGDNGVSCTKCPEGTWSQFNGSASCTGSFTYSTPGSEKFYIPPEVKKINVKLWGGGGGGFVAGTADWKQGFGGGGGYSSCNVTVNGDSLVYLIVAGGGRTFSGGDRSNSNYGGT